MQSLIIVSAMLGLWACGIGEDQSAPHSSSRGNTTFEKYYVAGLAEPAKGSYTDEEGVKRGDEVIYFYAELVFDNDDKDELQSVTLKDSSDADKCRHFDNIEHDGNDWLLDTTNFGEDYKLYIEVRFDEGNQISEGLFSIDLFRYYDKTQITDYRFMNGIHSGSEESDTVVYKKSRNMMDKRNMQEAKVITLKEVMDKFGDGSGCDE